MFISTDGERERARTGIVFVFVCEERAVGMETLVIIRWRDVTVPNGSLCDCQCGHFRSRPVLPGYHSKRFRMRLCKNFTLDVTSKKKNK